MMLTKESKLKGKFRWLLLLVAILCIGVLAGCNTGDGEDDDDDGTSSGRWTLISMYFYYYNDDGQRIREVDDNNASNSIDAGDERYDYSYDSDGLRTGYLRYDGNDIDPAGVGTYFYDINDCNDRLEEETPQGTDLQVWTYNVNSDCSRNSYHYDGQGEEEDGTYFRNTDGFITKLALDSGYYWEYTLDDNGDRLRYDYYDADDDLVRYGVYMYDSEGRLDQLNNYELL